MNTFLDTLRNLGPVRLGVMAAVMAGLIAFFIFMGSRLATPEMALLYADLDIAESGQIVSKLEELNIPYELQAGGQQIQVPAEEVARLRVRMAEEGLPSGGSVGYEIFDRSDGLGTSSFVQNINHLRALEGELSRTIGSVAGVRQARVHLVLPRRELFSRDRQDASASIALVMNGNLRLEPARVRAIQHLVAAAVPRLSPSNVSIIDDTGELLARGDGTDSATQLMTTAEERRIAHERRLVRTIEELLGQTLGPGNVRARVTAEMDFDRITENSEIYDPDGQVVRSTQTVEESSDDSDGGSDAVTVGNNLPEAGLPAMDEGPTSQSSSQRVEETVNYEISKTVKTHVREAGDVRRLSVAVVVNDAAETGPNGETTFTPRSQEELDRLGALVRSAIGFDEARGDTIEVVSMPFIDRNLEADVADQGVLGLSKADIWRLLEIVVLGVVAILVLLLVVRPLLLRLLEAEGETPALPGHAHKALGGEQPKALTGPSQASPDHEATVAQQLAVHEYQEPTEVEQMIDLNQVEGRVRASSIRKIGEIIEKHPEEAVTIIRGWLHQGS